MENLIDQIKQAEAKRRSELLSYIITKFPPTQATRLQNRTCRLRLDFSDPQSSPNLTNEQRAKLLHQHPFGLEVLLRDDNSLAEADTNHFLRLRIESVHDAAKRYLTQLGNSQQQIATLAIIYKTLNQRADELQRRFDLPSKECLKRADLLAKAFLNDTSILLAQRESGAEQVSKKQVKRAVKRLTEAEQRFPCQDAKRDVLTIRLPGDALTAQRQANTSFSWEYYRRHYHHTPEQHGAIPGLQEGVIASEHLRINADGPVPSASAHDPKGYDLTNFG